MGRKRTGGIDIRDGRVYARVTVTLTDGRTVRRRVRLDQGLSRVIAKREAKKLSKDSEGFRFDPKSKAVVGTAAAAPLVDAYHDRWADDRERRGRVSERGRYENHVRPIIGGKPMDKVTKDNARRLSAELDDKVLAGSIHWTTAVKAWGVATKMFRDACTSKIAALRVLEVNPFDGVPGPERGERKPKQWLFPTEASALFACEDVPLRWRCLYALATYLYPRPGELAALEWKDVHFAQGYVHIHQSLDLRTGEVKETKTGITRKVPIHPSLRPLLEALHDEAGGIGRVVKHDHENKEAEHGFPPLEDLAATLRTHLLRANVDRAELHEDRATTKRITFYDLRASGITWEALAGTEPLTIMQRAGHKDFKTTQGYIREAEAIGLGAGKPFPRLPKSLIVAAHNGRVAPSDRKSSSKKARNSASPTGFEDPVSPRPRTSSPEKRRDSSKRSRPSPSVDDVRAEKTRPVPSRSVEDVRAALILAAGNGDTEEIRRLVGELERLEGVARRLRLVK
jgi:integrase